MDTAHALSTPTTPLDFAIDTSRARILLGRAREQHLLEPEHREQHACGASRPSAVATRSHQRAARPLDLPSVSNAQSALQGRNRDDRSRRPHTTGVSLRMFSIACVHVCVRLRSPAVASSGGAGRARGTPSYLVGFARC